ncbi:1385_t:CDS:2, partial [Entrophospora sp. SA101]
ASLGYVFGKPSKSITSSLSSSSSSLSKKKNYVNTITINDNNFPVKKRFNLFRLKSNKHHRHRHDHCDSDNRNNNKIISDDVTFDKMIAEPETFI